MATGPEKMSLRELPTNLTPYFDRSGYFGFFTCGGGF